MNETLFDHTIMAVVTLLLVAAVAAVVLRKLRFPYTIGLVLVGIALGFAKRYCPPLEILESVSLTPHLILYVLVPTLVFDASVKIDARAMLKNIAPILLLAAPGLVLATFITAAMLAYGSPVNITVGAAFLFGALISATDPVAVIALFDELGAPKRLTMLVDGESVFNDATAIVMFQIVMGVLSAGVAAGLSTITNGCLDFVGIFVGGVLLGAVIGLAAVKAMCWAGGDPVIDLAFSLVAALASFIVADHFFQVSGVMSVLGAGLVVSWFGSTRFTREERDYLHRFWGFASFAANSFIFLLLGITEDFLIMDIAQLEGVLWCVLFAVIAVTAARAAVVFGLVPLFNLASKMNKINAKYQAVMFWGGLRGAVPMALVFSIDHDFPERRLLIQLTLGVVLFTLLVQGTTISRLMAWLKLDQCPALDRILKASAQAGNKRAAVKALDELTDQNLFFPREMVEDMRRAELEDMNACEYEIERVRHDTGDDGAAVTKTLWWETLAVEFKTNRRLFDIGVISEKVFRELDHALLLRSDALSRGEIPPPDPNRRPLEMKVEMFLVHLVKKIIPAGVIGRHRIRHAESDIEEASAMLAAASQVLEAFEDICATLRPDREAAAVCREHYELLAAASRKRLAAARRGNPELDDRALKRILARVLAAAEIEATDEQVHNGRLPEGLAREIIAEINRRAGFVNQNSPPEDPLSPGLPQF